VRHAIVIVGRAAVLAGALAVLAACSSSGGGSDEPGADLAPTAAPSGWTSHDLGPVTMSSPTDWVSYDPDAPSEPGTAAYGLKSPLAADDAGTGGVYVLTAAQPERDAAESTSNSRTVAEATQGAEDIVEQTLTWPGAEAAGFLSYESEMPADAGATERYRFELLTLDLSGGDQVFVTVVGPAATFEDDGKHSVLASVTVGS
jgi:hypothetical protein